MTTPASPVRDKGGKNAHEKVLDEIYNLRMKVYEEKDHRQPAIKIAVSKKEKEEILNNYFSAKRQLNSVTTGK
jgi:hypothetical protein